MKPKLLLVCMHNLRNPMAEGFLHQTAAGRFDICSAWVESNTHDPLVNAVMREEGISVAQNRRQTRRYHDINRLEKFHYIITMCDSTDLLKCPVFPNAGKRVYWNVESPGQVRGSEKERLEKMRAIRDGVKLRVEDFFREIGYDGVVKNTDA